MILGIQTSRKTVLTINLKFNNQILLLSITQPSLGCFSLLLAEGIKCTYYKPKLLAEGIKYTYYKPKVQQSDLTFIYNLA